MQRLMVNSFSPLSPAQIKSLKIPELKDRLRSGNLPITGKKQQLIDRLTDGLKAKKLLLSDELLTGNEIVSTSHNSRTILKTPKQATKRPRLEYNNTLTPCTKTEPDERFDDDAPLFGNISDEELSELNTDAPVTLQTLEQGNGAIHVPPDEKPVLDESTHLLNPIEIQEMMEASKNVPFDSNADFYTKQFCPNCGAILGFYSRDSAIACDSGCRQFALPLSKAGHFGVQVELVSGRDFNTEEMFGVEDEEDASEKANFLGKHPITERICSKCGASEMRYVTQQLRSADEGMTVFYFCLKCNNQEVEHT